LPQYENGNKVENDGGGEQKGIIRAISHFAGRKETSAARDGACARNGGVVVARYWTFWRLQFLCDDFLEASRGQASV